MLNNSTVKELLKKNDLDGLYDYFYNQFGDSYEISSYISPLNDILIESGIDPLRYIESLAWYKIPESMESADYSKYTNIKRIDISGFEGSEIDDQLLALPNSIQIIEENAFADVYCYDGGGIKVSTKSLKRVGSNGLSIAEGPIIIDKQKFYISNGQKNDEMMNYLRSKGVKC